MERKYLWTTALCVLLTGASFAQTTTNILRYGNCEGGKQGWYTWTGSGEIEVGTDSSGLNSGKGTKIVATGDSVKGSVSMPFSYRGEIEVSGYAESTTSQTSKISLQCFDSNSKTVAWIDVAYLKEPGRKYAFRKKVTIPQNAAKTNLAVSVSGAGEIRVDDLVVTAVHKPIEDASIKVPSVDHVTIERIKSVKTDRPLIALTFDDGPNALSPKYLELFKKEGIKATFFWKGKSVVARPELARRIIAEGHEVGNHSYSHPHFNKLSDTEAYKEVIDTQKVIKEITGVTPTLFRAPYILYTPKLMEILQATDLQPIDCSVGVSDWHKDTTVELIIERATTEKTQAGTIMLMHDWSPKSLEALPTIIADLKAKGYQFVTVSELLAAES